MYLIYLIFSVRFLKETNILGSWEGCYCAFTSIWVCCQNLVLTTKYSFSSFYIDLKNNAVNIDGL